MDHEPKASATDQRAESVSDGQSRNPSLTLSARLSVADAFGSFRLSVADAFGSFRLSVADAFGSLVRR